MVKKCLICDKEFYCRPSRNKKGLGKFCSKECYHKWYSLNVRTKRGGKIIIECCVCGKKKTIFKSRKGENNFCSKGCLHKWRSDNMIANNPVKRKEVKDKIFDSLKKHYDIVGRSDRTKRRRVYDKKYKGWRLKVFKRDNYTCQKCDKSSCYLEPHHIENWATHKKLRYIVKNGITFCGKCHKKFHKRFGYTNDKKQVDIFLK